MNENYKNYSLTNIPGEIWKDIKGYEGLYQVSNFGRVKALSKTSVIHSTNNLNGSKRNRTEKIHRCQLQKDGYVRTQLYKNNKRCTVKVHRLVAEAFLPNPNNYPMVNHKNEIKSDNCVENLEWCTCSYNAQYSSYKKHKKIKCITTGMVFNSVKEAKKFYNIKDHRKLTAEKYCGVLSDGTKLSWIELDDTEVNE